MPKKAEPILCSKCHRPVRADAEFCGSCGQRLKKSCINTACDAVLSSSDTHCWKCGVPQGGAGFLSRNPQLVGEAAKAAPDLIKGGLGCLKDFIMLLGLPGIAVVVVLLIVNSLTHGWITDLLFGWVWTAIGGWVMLAVFAFVGYQTYKRGLLERFLRSARESGQRNRTRRLEAQRRKAAQVLRSNPPPAVQLVRPMPAPADKTIVCSRCGSIEVELDDSTFCNNCGFNLHGPTVTTVLSEPPESMPEPVSQASAPTNGYAAGMPHLVHCDNCGQLSRVEEPFCPNCGTVLIEESPRVVPPRLDQIAPLPPPGMFQPAPIAPPPPVPPAPVGFGFSRDVIDAQIRRVTVRLGGNRAQAELIVREAIAECGQDFSVTTLFKMVNDVLLRQA